jgi:hypothetical protein
MHRDKLLEMQTILYELLVILVKLALQDLVGMAE